jgi:FkbM family methyltransferase
MMSNRLGWYLNARLRARRLGFVFWRRRGFEVPSRLAVNGGSAPIECPAERGCRTDFIGIFLSDCYRLETVKRLDGTIRTVLDVGANCGWFSIAARSHFPDAAIHAYEPNPAILPDLRHNTRDLGVVVHSEAVGASDGTVAMVCGAETNQGRTVDGGKIPRTAFAAAIERLGGTADLVKLDCEGAEWAMLDDPEPWRAVRWLTMEYHLWAQPGATHDDAARAVNALGFEILEQQPTGDYGLLLGRRPANPSTWPRRRADA